MDASNVQQMESYKEDVHVLYFFPFVGGRVVKQMAIGWRYILERIKGYLHRMSVERSRW